MQEIIQVEIAVNPSTLGELEDTELKILIKTRNKVTKRVIRPGITCGSIKKLTYNSIYLISKINTKIFIMLKRLSITNCYAKNIPMM